MMTINRVFVYGTLRKGWGLNRYIEDYKGKFINTVKLKGYKMFSLGPFPAINESTNEEDYVIGEVYEFPEENLEKAIGTLDAIELGAGYRRDTIEIDKILTNLYVHKTNFNDRGYIVMKDWTKEARK